MKKTNYFKVMYQIKKHDKFYPDTIHELEIKLLQLVRNEKLKKLNKVYEQ